MRQEYSRSHMRYDVQGIEGSFLFNIDVDIKNLSVAGMAVRTNKALNVGRRYVFTIHKGPADLQVTGRVAWCVLGGKRADSNGRSLPVFNAGIQFQHVLSGDAEGLLQMLEESAVVNLDRRVFGRFRLGEHAQMQVDAGLDFEVRRISMSGMLVEVEGEVGHVARLDEVFPLEVTIPEGKLCSTGRVAFVNTTHPRHNHPKVVQLGIEFDGLQQSARELLGSFIASTMVRATAEAEVQN